MPTLGGQTALNAAVELAKSGVLDKFGVEMIGCDLAAIERGEDRKQFNECMAELGIETARSDYAYRDGRNRLGSCPKWLRLLR